MGLPTRIGGWGQWEVPRPFPEVEGQRHRRRNWVQAAEELPGVSEDDMSIEDNQRKHGTSRGSPRRQRTARASRISRSAVKSGCAHKWGGWGRLSVDGPRQNNSDRSEGPWGRATEVARTEVHKRAASPDTERGRDGASGGHEGRRQTGGRGVIALLGRPCLIYRP